MKIIISRVASAFVPGTREEITDARRLQSPDGLDYSKDRCSNYFDQSLEDIGLTGGVIALAFDAKSKGLQVVTEYQSPRRLKPAELKRLVKATVGQWSDGIGEGDFRHRKRTKIDVNLYPSGSAKVTTEQIDDGQEVRKPRRSELLKALERCNWREAEQVLSGGASVKCKDKEGNTPLHLACSSGAFGLALRLLECGADVHAKNKSGEAPLVRLARVWVLPERTKSCLSVAQALLQHGTCVDARDKIGETPLMWAVNKGNVPLIKLLINAGADVNAQDHGKYNQHTVIMHAKRMEVVELLLRCGADPSVRNGVGETAWEYKIACPDRPEVEKLADRMRSYWERKQKRAGQGSNQPRRAKRPSRPN
ncbi:MAG: ankyrin repeat domain-containing protein [Thermoguttaceae bacterium]